MKYIPLAKRSKKTANEGHQNTAGVVETQHDSWRTRQNNKPLQVTRRTTHA